MKEILFKTKTLNSVVVLKKKKTYQKHRACKYTKKKFLSLFGKLLFFHSMRSMTFFGRRNLFKYGL